MYKISIYGCAMFKKLVRQWVKSVFTYYGSFSWRTGFFDAYVFLKGSRYTGLVQEQFAEEFPETPVPHHNVICRLIEKFR